MAARSHLTRVGAGGAVRPDRKADRYESLYPGTGIPEAQKEERMERLDLKADRATHRRSNRLRGIVVPAAASCFDENGRLRP